MKKKKWIRKALSNKKQGALSRQLGIPVEENIPISVLTVIRDSPINSEAYITYKGKTKKMKVTPLLKRRAVLALTLKRIRK